MGSMVVWCLFIFSTPDSGSLFHTIVYTQSLKTAMHNLQLGRANKMSNMILFNLIPMHLLTALLAPAELSLKRHPSLGPPPSLILMPLDRISNHLQPCCATRTPSEARATE